jgi:TonB family protein
MGKWILPLVLMLVVAGPAGAAAPVFLSGGEEPGEYFLAVDVMPETIYRSPIEYPAEAKAKGIEGKVTVSLRVEIDGTVSNPKVTSSSGSSLLDQAALAMAGKYRFKPALQDGKPVAVWVSFVVKFSLDENKTTAPSESFIAVDEEPEIIKQVEPTYPPEAVAAKIEGKVFIHLFVNADGKVTQSKVAKSSGNKLLDDAALEAGRKYEFKPARQGDRPVAVWVSMPVVFALQ